MKSKSKSKVLYSITDLDFPLTLSQEGQDSFTITYGEQVTSGLGYRAAKEEFADAIFHALQLAGKFDQ